MRKHSSKLKKSSGQRPRRAAAKTDDSVIEADQESLKSAAARLGRIGGKKGGVARARKLSARRRSQIARKAANTRWSRRLGR